MNEQEQQSITNPVTETEQVEVPVQENTQEEIIDKSNESSLEAPTSDVKPEGDINTPSEDKNVVEDQPVVSDEVQKKLDKLKEYEVKENELNELKQRLGTNAPQDNLIFRAQQELNVLENQAQQDYIKLCNEYGVDYRPEFIDKSSQELQEKDPKAFYELRYKLNDLCNRVDARRSQVETFIAMRDVNLAMERNRQIFEASPAINQVVNTLIQNGGYTGADIDEIVQYGLTIAREAYEMGRQAATPDVVSKAVEPAKVLNNNVITQQGPTGIPTETLTLEDVEKMDIKTYAKNAALIDRLYAEGKLK